MEADQQHKKQQDVETIAHIHISQLPQHVMERVFDMALFDAENDYEVVDLRKDSRKNLELVSTYWQQLFLSRMRKWQKNGIYIEQEKQSQDTRVSYYVDIFSFTYCRDEAKNLRHGGPIRVSPGFLARLIQSGKVHTQFLRIPALPLSIKDQPFAGAVSFPNFVHAHLDSNAEILEHGALDQFSAETLNCAQILSRQLQKSLCVAIDQRAKKVKFYTRLRTLIGEYNNKKRWRFLTCNPNMEQIRITFFVSSAWKCFVRSEATHLADWVPQREGNAFINLIKHVRKCAPRAKQCLHVNYDSYGFGSPNHFARPNRLFSAVDAVLFGHVFPAIAKHSASVGPIKLQFVLNCILQFSYNHTFHEIMASPSLASYCGSTYALWDGDDPHDKLGLPCNVSPAVVWRKEHRSIDFEVEVFFVLCVTYMA